MPDHWTPSQTSTQLAADSPLHQRLLSMPAANDAPTVTEPGFFTFITAWRERQYAADCCRELLGLHEVVAHHHPQLSGVELYRHIVVAHIGGDAQVADTLLHRAQESYATWPVRRALNFRDVVHYLAVSGYWALHRGRRWICSDIRGVINAAIPHQL
jgi:hypothetical protein